MARSRWKVPFFNKQIWNIIFLLKAKKILKKKLFLKKRLKLYTRASLIPLALKKFNVRVHKGRLFRSLQCSLLNVSYKFGEFGYTRKLNYYSLGQKKRR